MVRPSSIAAPPHVAREAWRIFVSSNRRELYEYMESLHISAIAMWRSYEGNTDRSDLGPYELNRVDWYRKNVNWDGWLRSVHRWASERLKQLIRRVHQFQNVCSCAVLVFKGEQEVAMDENLSNTFEETRDVLGCFIDGWQNTCFNMSLADFCSFAAGPKATTRWNISLASREAEILRQRRDAATPPL